jgi:hypothetical protein
MDWMVSNPVVAGIRIFALPDVNAKPGGSVSFKEVAARFVGEGIGDFKVERNRSARRDNGTVDRLRHFEQGNVWTDVEQVQSRFESTTPCWPSTAGWKRPLP